MLVIESTSTTPGITMDSERGYIEINGKSVPENSIEFYKPVFKWLDDYLKNPKESTVVAFKILYFNTTTAKQFQNLLITVKRIREYGKQVKVDWYYEDGDLDMREVGEDFQKLTGIEFSMKEVDDLIMN